MQIIVVDDHSGEEGPDDVKWLVTNHEAMLIRHEQNRGLASARNTALTAASGRFFAFCDDDDEWPDGIASRMMAAIDEGPSDVGVCIVLPANRRPQCESFFANYPPLTEVIRKGFTPPVSSQLYRLDMLRAIGGYDTRVASGVDHDLWISLAATNPRVAVSWGEPARIGKDSSGGRMTTVESRRRQRLAEALEIWKPKITTVFGEHFYLHFCHSYAQYLDYRFFMESIRRRDYAQAAARMLNRHVARQIARKMTGRIAGRKQWSLFPSYKEP